MTIRWAANRLENAIRAIRDKDNTVTITACVGRANDVVDTTQFLDIETILAGDINVASGNITGMVKTLCAEMENNRRRLMVCECAIAGAVQSATPDTAQEIITLLENAADELRDNLEIDA